MTVAGLDYSSHHVDAVFVGEDGQAEWHRWSLEGADAFDRARSVREAMPARGWWTDEGVIAVGIEHPAGHHGTGPLLRIQGAILSCLPPSLLVQPWPPSAWRKAVGLPGNASKQAVWDHATPNPMTGDRFLWPQDARDAYCIAQATAAAIEQAAA